MLLIHPIDGEIKGVHTFHKGISPKMIVITRLEFELAYNYIAVLHISHYNIETPHRGVSIYM